MSEEAGEKTEAPTAKRLREAADRGDIARSPDLESVAVMFAGLGAIKMFGPTMWSQFSDCLTGIATHLNDVTISRDSLPGQTASAMLLVSGCAAPVVLAVGTAGAAVSAAQNQFNLASDAISLNWEKLNPVSGFTRIASVQGLVPALSAVIKLAVIGGFAWSEVQNLLQDPILYTSGDLFRIGRFLMGAAESLLSRILVALTVIAAADYGYQFWTRYKKLMMTKEEVKEESKSSEGNPHVRAQQRRRRRARSQRQMLQDVPTADVVVTNPTHIAVALRYDRKSMKAPMIIAKGTRLNALRIREIAKQHQVPIVENKPLARLMFKHGRVGGEIPIQLFAAVAEILAFVYRTNRYRYYTAGAMN